MIMLECPPRPPGLYPTAADTWLRTAVMPHAPALRRYLRGRFRLEAEADDILQETYLRLLKIQADRPVRRVRGLFFTIARNLALDHLRRRQRAPFVEITYEQACAVEAGEPSAAECAVRNEEFANVQAMIADLPEHLRAAMQLRHFEELDCGAAAARLGVSPRAFEYRLGAARRRCAAMLGVQGRE